MVLWILSFLCTCYFWVLSYHHNVLQDLLHPTYLSTTRSKHDPKKSQHRLERRSSRRIRIPTTTSTSPTIHSTRRLSSRPSSSSTSPIPEILQATRILRHPPSARPPPPPPHNLHNEKRALLQSSQNHIRHPALHPHLHARTRPSHLTLCDPNGVSGGKERQV